ncbi:hypothetical protein AURANDRAFT_67710 [Aureococcus anophagefferens]|uniref:Uncharacterized protein n=1 Tax=Aureococcus anophagefferens TaxID=44056 RepID=F0YM49_AURAN|nr:hypothetical protein AURANDRAFT_67710 [Aureococcus anophagefferens]EGB03816.1 hypothetical protein AURANDRAFT_67710 [Aureococcus anophagefferens]|eukprot:XP_009041474.1 hypothetical protein AURANDRAFT_67710 [Aureococcus anophagefferens]
MSAGLDSVIAPELVKAMSEQFTMELSATVPAAVFQARPVVIKQISLGHARRARCGRCGYGSVCIRGKSTMIGAVRVYEVKYGPLRGVRSCCGSVVSHTCTPAPGHSPNKCIDVLARHPLAS